MINIFRSKRLSEVKEELNNVKRLLGIRKQDVNVDLLRFIIWGSNPNPLEFSNDSRIKLIEKKIELILTHLGFEDGLRHIAGKDVLVKRSKKR